VYPVRAPPVRAPTPSSDCMPIVYPVRAPTLRWAARQ